ncbi:MAG: MBL fold metallo-hydrolase, partial [Parasporobacterium sp.]|nr:MBL fold metallo-hydrolase [Parasporobacterium sp.]
MNGPDLKEIFASFFAWKAKPDTWIISFMSGTQFLYLLEGTEKALLIDTGYAVGGLREFVEKLTDKPIEVINTHFHPD